MAFARYASTDYLFVASERSNLVTVFDMSSPSQPAFKQALPGAISPEGLLTIASRGLLISASEVDDRGLPTRSALNIYAYQKASAAYPTIASANLVFKVSATGVIERVIALPAAQNDMQTRYGFESVTEHAGKPLPRGRA